MRKIILVSFLCFAASELVSKGDKKKDEKPKKIMKCKVFDMKTQTCLLWEEEK